MARKFLSGIDLVQTQLLNAQIQNLAAAPSSPLAGQIYYDTTQNAMFYWNATAAAWQFQATNALLLQGQNGAYYLARGNQTGTQLAATISNLQATVLAYTLDTFAAPVNPLNLNGQRITSLGVPVSATDAATKSYVDTSVQGLSQKPAAQVATAAALPAYNYANGAAGLGATLTGTANGALTIDSYAPPVGANVLVKNETGGNAPYNGLYTVTAAGAAGAAYVLTRNVDMSTSAQFGGAFVAVENNGATTANTLWLANVANAITVGTTSVTFTQLNAATSYTAGNGIAISAGTVSATVVAGGGVLSAAGGLSLDTTVAVRKFAATIGDGATTAITVAHNLGTLDTTEAVYTVAGGAEVDCDITHATVNTTTFTFAVAPAANVYRVVIHG